MKKKNTFILCFFLNKFCKTNKWRNYSLNELGLRRFEVNIFRFLLFDRNFSAFNISLNFSLLIIVDYCAAFKSYEFSVMSLEGYNEKIKVGNRLLETIDCNHSYVIGIGKLKNKIKQEVSFLQKVIILILN